MYVHDPWIRTFVVQQPIPLCIPQTTTWCTVIFLQSVDARGFVVYLERWGCLRRCERTKRKMEKWREFKCPFDPHVGTHALPRGRAKVCSQEIALIFSISARPLWGVKPKSKKGASAYYFCTDKKCVDDTNLIRCFKRRISGRRIFMAHGEFVISGRQNYRFLSFGANVKSHLRNICNV